MTIVRYGVLAWLCTAATIAYVHRNSISVLTKPIETDLGLSKPQMGYVMGGFFLSYALCQIPAGWLANRYGNRAMLTVYAAGWSLSTVWMGLATGYVSMLASRLVNGVFQAGLLPCSAIGVRHWFSVARRAFPTGMLSTFQQVGALLTLLVTPLFVEVLSRRTLSPESVSDWRVIFVIYGAIGLAWTAGFYFWFRDTPQMHPQVDASELQLIRGEPSPPIDGDNGDNDKPLAPGSRSAASAAVPHSTPWLTMFTSTTMLLICGQQFFRGAGYIFYATWFPTFLRETGQISDKASAYLTMLPILAVAIGSAAGGAMVDLIQSRTGSRRLSRQVLAAVCMAASALFIVPAYFVVDAMDARQLPPPEVAQALDTVVPSNEAPSERQLLSPEEAQGLVTRAVLLITLGALFAGFGGPISLTVTIDLSGRHVGTTIATMNMAGNLGATVFPIVAAQIADQGDWNQVLLLFIAIYAAATLCWMFLNPDRPIFTDEELA